MIVIKRRYYKTMRRHVNANRTWQACNKRNMIARTGLPNRSKRQQARLRRFACEGWSERQTVSATFVTIRSRSQLPRYLLILQKVSVVFCS
ncbi:MAG: hypothetical protein KGI29_07230 [Pseudomonadota bacterium]|nr:hypothetical protein [Pseudomonadota bacterium]